MNHEQSSFFKKLLKTASVLYKDKMLTHDSNDLYPIGFIPRESELGQDSIFVTNQSPYTIGSYTPSGHVYYLKNKPNLYFVNGTLCNHNSYYENNAMLLLNLAPNTEVTLCFETLGDTKNYIVSDNMVLICQ